MSIWWTRLAALTAACALVACDGEIGSELAAGAGAGSGFNASSSSSGQVFDNECDPPCSGGMVCSHAGQCIDSGTCLVNEDCAQGTICAVDAGECVPGGDCGEQEFAITAQPPNVLIALDRTGSMGAEVPGSGGKSRWQVASEAVASVLGAYDGAVNFGLDIFSACVGNGCAAGTIVEPIGATTAAINQSVAQTYLCNSGDPETVIGGTLQVLVGEPSLQDPARSNIVLLITDGHDNCGGGGVTAATELLNQPVPVPVYVVGFSGGVNAFELESIAQAAGTAPYYQADDATQLNAALQSIIAGVASCTYQLADPPDDQLFVFFNNDPGGVPGDGGNGWTYDPVTKVLTFHGAACDQIKDGTVTDIDVVFGCAAPTPD